MVTKVVVRGTWLVGFCLLLSLAGCAETRGKFGSGACATKVPVNANAVVAVYYDKLGNQVGTRIEDLYDTSDKKMCEDYVPQQPGACGSYCTVVINGQAHCYKC
jgi:hypothetical protein